MAAAIFHHSDGEIAMLKSGFSGKHTRRAMAKDSDLIDGRDAIISFSSETMEYFRELEEAMRRKLPAITEVFPHDELLAYDLVRDCSSGRRVTMSDALWKLPAVSSQIKEYTLKTGDSELDTLYSNIENGLMERGAAFVTAERQRGVSK